MSKRSGKFGRLLTKAVRQIAAQEDKTIQVIQDELAYAIGRGSGSCIDYWRRGHPPAYSEDLEALAQEIARRRGLATIELPDFVFSVEPYYPQDRLDNLVKLAANGTLPLPQPPQAMSPFVVGPPITRPTQFFGREQELRRIFAWWRRFPLQNVALVGPKRSGKTSLLCYLQRIHTTAPSQLRPGQKRDWLPAAETYQWLLVDFQDPRLCRRERLLRYLLTELSLPVPSPCTLDDFMDVISNRLRRPTIILMDELIAGLVAPELDEAFWWGLRALISHHADGNLAFVLTAHDFPMQLAEDQGKPSPFFNMFSSLELGPLEEHEARELVASSPQPFTPDDVAWILQQSRRWPALLQILCRARLDAVEGNLPEHEWRQEGLRQLRPFDYLLHA